MYKVYCDMCGKPIDHDIDGVNLDFNHYGVVQFRSNWKAEKQLCIACATRVLKWIDDECEKIKKEMEGDMHEETSL